MSHNDNIPERSARRHLPALWALGMAIGLALVAFLLFSSMGGDEPAPQTVETQAPGTDSAVTSDPPIAAGAEQGTATAPARSN